MAIASHRQRSGERKACIGLALFVVLGACRVWPRDNPLDPGRCSPRCSGGQICQDGTCKNPVPDGPAVPDAVLLPDARAPHDSSAHDQQQHAPQLVVRTFAGTGTPGLVNGPADKAQFNTPFGISLGGDGLYVADSGNNAIRMIANANVSTLAGSGVANYLDGSAVTACFYSPNSVVAVSDGKEDWVYVADTGNFRVRLIDSGQVSFVAGMNVGGAMNGHVSVALFNRPIGVAYTAQALYVADSTNCCLRRIDWQTAQVTTAAGLCMGCGAVSGEAALARFQSLTDVAADSTGKLYLADAGNHAIWQLAGTTASVLAGTGTAGFLDGPALQAKFNSPNAVAVDSAGKVYVADGANSRIRVIEQGRVSTLAGSGEAGFLDGPALQAKFNAPGGVAVDSLGKVYVADTANNRIRVIELSTSAASTSSTR